MLAAVQALWAGQVRGAGGGREGGREGGRGGQLPRVCARVLTKKRVGE
jgi:hypothetical protein